MKVYVEDVFKNEEDYYHDEILHLIRFEDFDKATEVKEEFLGNSGWYNEFRLKFTYENKRYMIDYKEHTSDNVSDFEYTSDLILLGDSEELIEEITKEDLEVSKAYYEKRIEKLKKELEEQKQASKKEKEFYLMLKKSKHLDILFKIVEDSFIKSNIHPKNQQQKQLYEDMIEVLKKIRSVFKK